MVVGLIYVPSAKSVMCHFAHHLDLVPPEEKELHAVFMFNIIPISYIWSNHCFLFNNLGFLGGSDSKESACNAGNMGSVPGLGRFLGEGHGTPGFLPEECHGQRSLAGYSPWGHRFRHD